MLSPVPLRLVRSLVRVLTVFTAVGLTAAVVGAPAARAVGAKAGPHGPLPDLSRGPVAGAHAHNDYLHERPLLDALEHGFTSVEADVFLAPGTLLVAHTVLETRPTRTLRALYLDPLSDLVAHQRLTTGRASVWPHDPTRLQLMIDLKSDGVPTWREIERELATYPPGVFTRVVDGRVVPGAVDVVLSGNRPLEPMLAARDSATLVDGRPSDLGRGIPAERMPMVSESFAGYGWVGIGPMPRRQREAMCALTGRAAGGHTMRFWGTTDIAGLRERVWRTERACRVTWLNADDLAGLERWLRR